MTTKNGNPQAKARYKMSIFEILGIPSRGFIDLINIACVIIRYEKYILLNMNVILKSKTEPYLNVVHISKHRTVSHVNAERIKK